MPSKINMSRRNGSLGFSKDTEHSPRGEKIGRRCGYDVYLWTDGEQTEIQVLDPNLLYRGERDNLKIVLRLNLLKSENNKRAWWIELVKVDPRYAGKNIAVRIYTMLLKRGIMLEAGHEQSAGGRKLWNKLAKRSDVLLYAKYDNGKYSRKKHLVRYGKNDEVISDSIDVYTNDDMVNLYAVAVG